MTFANCSALVPGELPNDKVEWNKHCAQYGLAPGDRLRLFRSPRNSRTFQLVSLAPRRPKYPVVALGAQGGRYKFQASDVAFLSGNATPAPAPAPTVKADSGSSDSGECIDEPD